MNNNSSGCSKECRHRRRKEITGPTIREKNTNVATRTGRDSQT
jgi:hypothetical protein